MDYRPDAEGRFATSADRAAYNHAFERLLRALRSRIGYFIRRYGLMAHWEDAEQVGALAVHRAIAGYDPEKAQFTTFVNWQIRGDMQALRYTVMVDQRAPAKKISASTVSLQSLLSNTEGQEGQGFDIEDENAFDMVERGASDYLAVQTMRNLMDKYVKKVTDAGLRELHRRRSPSNMQRSGVARLKINSIDPELLRELENRVRLSRRAIATHLFEIENDQGEAGELTPERSRQLVRQAVKTLRTIISEHSDFSMLSENIPAVDMHSIRHRRPTSHPAVGSHRPLSIKSLERVVGKLACAG
jgi:RNA polymerase sigma-32 factor